MFGLPTHRTSSTRGTGIVDCNLTYGCNGDYTIKSGLKLVEMKFNHYTMILSQDHKSLRSWGSKGGCYNTWCGHAGLGPNSNDPQAVVIDWRTINGVREAREIEYISSQGIAGGGTSAFGLFRCANGDVYGSGENNYGILNTGSTATGRNGFTFMMGDVSFLEMAGGTSGGFTLTYVRNNGKVYALGLARNRGWGPNKIGVNLLTDDGTDTNYIGIDQADKAWTWCVDNNITDGSVTFVIKKDKTLWACGNNTSGNLGVGSDTVSITNWTQVIDQDGNPLQNVSDVWHTNAGIYTTYIIANKRVYTCGSNTSGGLGLNLATNQTRNRATIVPGIEKARLMTTSYYGQSIAVATEDNKVYTWGKNNNGECGNGTTSIIATPYQTSIPTTSPITFMHGGGRYIALDHGLFGIVREAGDVFVAGSNIVFALGVPNKNGQNITSFTRNVYFGFPSGEFTPSIAQSWRYPLVMVNGGSYAAGVKVIDDAVVVISKNVTPQGMSTRQETLSAQKGMEITGPGIPAYTKVTFVDNVNKKIGIDKETTSAQLFATLSYTYRPLAYQCDFCGYLSEQSMKIVTSEGTLFQMGWNQLVDGIYNFNPRAGGYFPNSGQQVDVPSSFEASF
jgi:alpha-tubulin suppressor-like RCC1 family protein